MTQSSKAIINFWINKINGFYRSQNLKIDPLPSVQLIDSNDQKNDVSDILISTGGYMPKLQQIILYIDNRHIKDILRSYCHELIHHVQNLDNSDYIRRVFKHASDDLVDNAQLEEVEGDAFLRGNLMFRKFTEQLKRNISKEIDKNDN